MDDPINSWPEHIVPLQPVRAWIAEALGVSCDAVQIGDVFQRQSWGVTAAFFLTEEGTINPGTQAGRRVVFKSNNLPQRRDMPGVYALLQRAVPDRVPQFLASRRADADGSAWLLFEHVDGMRVGEADDETAGRAAELGLARSLAVIQGAVADALASERECEHADHASEVALPRAPLASLAGAYDRVERVFRDTLWSNWQLYMSHQGSRQRLPDDLPKRLREHERAVDYCITELSRVGSPWQESVDHPDPHHRNAIIRPGGQMLIYDWDEATISCPYFSLDMLLDTIGEPGGLAYPGPFSTPPTQDVLERAAAVRAAYLEALPWGSRAECERALAVALCLAPLRTLAAILGVDAVCAAAGAATIETPPNEGLVAWLMARTFYRWDMLER